MRNMIVYYLRKRLPVLLILTVAFAITTIIMMSQLTFQRYVNENGIIREVPGDNPFIYLAVFFSIIASITPIMEFSFKMKRRSIDLFYSLPIKRIKLYAVKYCVGLIEVFVLSFPQWLISYIYVAACDNMFNLTYYIWFGLIAMVFVLCFYSYVTFFFTISNSMLDGVINALLAVCILPCIINVIYLFAGAVYKGNLDILYMRFYFLYSPLFDWATGFYYKMCGSYYETSFYKIHVLATVLVILLSLSSLFLFYLVNSVRNKGESVLDTSDSLFGFRVLIPAYMVTGFATGGTTAQSAAIWVIIALAGYLGYAIFRRNFKIEKRDLFAYLTSTLIGLLLAIFL